MRDALNWYWVSKKSYKQNVEGYGEKPEFWPRVAKTPLKTRMAQSGPKFWSPIIKAVKILLTNFFLGHSVRKMFGRIKWIDQEDEQGGRWGLLPRNGNGGRGNIARGGEAVKMD